MIAKFFLKINKKSLVKYLALIVITLLIIKLATPYFYHEEEFTHSLYSEKMYLNPMADKTCHSLLDDGKYEDAKKGIGWTPVGNCSMHSYTVYDSERCLKLRTINSKKRHWIILFGDSRMLGLFITLGELFGVDVNAYTHEDHHVNIWEHNFKLDFFWCTNITEWVKQSLIRYSRLEKDNRPTMIILGAALWPIRDSNFSKEALEEYRHNISSLLPPIRKLQNSSIVLWREQYPVNENMKYEKFYWNFVTNEKINAYNEAAEKSLNGEVKVWHSSRRTGEERMSFFTNSYHAGFIQRKTDSQILLNLYCNKATKKNRENCCSIMDE